MSSKQPAKKRKASAGDNDGKAEEAEVQDEWLALNVSGTRMLTQRSTLLSGGEGSVLSRMFGPDSPFGRLPRDGDGAFLLDRDAEAFQWILGVLRRGGAVASLPPEGLVDRVRNEADFFGLDEIVCAIDKRPAREQKCISEKISFTDFHMCDEKIKIIPDGWSVKSMNCVPVVQGDKTPWALRTILLERDATRIADKLEVKVNDLSLRVNGISEKYVPAKFGVMNIVSGLAVEARPSNMSEGHEPFLKNGQRIAGNVAVVQRGGCSFLQKARLAMEAGAVALVVRQYEHQEKLERMEAADANEASGIRIPVFMVKHDCRIFSGHTWVHLGNQVLW